jgi:hypothetical protein
MTDDNVVSLDMESKQELYEFLGHDAARYMTWRAGQEDTIHSLETVWYGKHIAEGVRDFFGLQVDSMGGLIYDEAEPDLFAEWMAEEAVREIEFEKMIAEMQTELELDDE